MQKVTVGKNFESDKLKSLQECLESDFLYSITNVYQSIYDTVDLTHSNKESAAIATAKGRVQLLETGDDFLSSNCGSICSR